MAESSQKSSGCSIEDNSVSMTTSGHPLVSPTPKCVVSGSHNNAGYDDLHAYQSVTQSQAIIYIVVILALYFSALIVLIVRYMRNERNQMRLPYLHPAILLGKKDRLGPRDRPEAAADLIHLNTVSTHLNATGSPLPHNNSPRIHLHLPLLPPPPSSTQRPQQQQPQMDTEV